MSSREDQIPRLRELQHTIGPAPQGVVMNALNRYLPSAYDAVHDVRRELRARPGPNPINALSSLLGIGDAMKYGPGAIAEGPATAALGPIRRGAKEVAERLRDGVAVRLDDGRIFSGSTADEVWRDATRQGVKMGPLDRAQKGFVTDAGNFVDQTEARNFQWENEPQFDVVRERLSDAREQLWLTRDGKKVATAKYVRTPNGISVEQVETKPEWRRQGFATRLYEEIQRSNPDASWINSEERTSAGNAFRAAWNQREAQKSFEQFKVWE